MSQVPVTAALRASLLGYYSVAGLLAFAYAYWSSLTVTVVLALVQVLAMGAVTVAALMYEEDWWDDFKGQNRSIAVGIVANVATVLVCTWLGRLA